MTNSYDADQLEAALNDTAVLYRRWLNNRDEWTGFEGDAQRARLHKLAGEAAGVVQELKAALDQDDDAGLAKSVAPEPKAIPQQDDDEFAGKVITGDGGSFQTYAYFEAGQFVVADDADEEWVVELGDLDKGKSGLQFPDNDGSLLEFVPTDPAAFNRALGEARRG